MNQKKKSKAQETRIAKDINGRPTIASGALYFQKADARSDKYLVECKFTEKESYTLTLATWEKITREALRDHMRTPIMNIQLPMVNLAVMSLDDFYDFSAPPYCPKLLRTEQVKLRVALSKKHIEGHLDSVNTILYSLILFEDIHLVVMSWEDFLLLNERDR